jgi:hypothetical protein
MAQQQLAFPFQGGKQVMTRFFKDSITVSKDIIRKRATGMAIFKFTADDQGNLSKIVVYYADDLLLTQPIIEALKKSNHKWIIPDREKFHDFIIPFSIRLNPPATGLAEVQKTHLDTYKSNTPLISADQIPLNEASLLPAIIVNYDITQ